MTELTQQDGNPVIDYQARDYQSLLQAMRQLIPQKMPEWLDPANEADFGNVLLELFAQMGDILSYYQDRVANESFLGTARSRRSVIQHLRLIGYQLGTAAPAAASLTLTVPGTVTATVTVNQGDAFATKSSKTQPSVRFEYTRATPLVIDFSSITADPGTGRKTFGDALAGIPVEEGRLFQGELIGTGDGSVNQRYPLAHSGLILRPPGSAAPGADVLLTTTVGSDVQAWTLRDTLAFSQGGQHDFTIEIDENDQATVVFGDGDFGAAPASGARIAASYRTGGGTAGNVPAGAIQTIVGAPQLALLGAAITNPAAATGGAERESIAHAVQQAPAVFRSLRRAVTADDYKALALSFQGVGKVRAVPGGWNQVSLLVAPAGGGKVSDVLEAALKAYLEDKRMLSQVIEILDVDYIPIRVTAQIAVQSYYVPTDVAAAVLAVAAAMLNFDQVDFGQAVYLSRYYERIQEVPGVTFVNITEFRRADDLNGPPVAPAGLIQLGPHEIPVIPSDAAYRAGLNLVITGPGGG
jgi:uncharacterized phage protein gp47/JayE